MSNIIQDGVIYTSDYTSVVGVDVATFPANGHIVLEPTVTVIGGSVFLDCALLKTIDLPATLTTINSFAFSRSGLTSVSIPYTSGEYLSIFSGAFSECLSLETVAFSPTLDALVEIDTNVFYKCSALTSITLPGGMGRLTGGTFNECTALPYVFIPLGVSVVQAFAFTNCTSLTTVDIEAGSPITTIDSYCFYNCPLTAFSFETCASLTSIGDNAFNNTNLVSITLPASVTYVGGDAFDFCNFLQNINILKYNSVTLVYDLFRKTYLDTSVDAKTSAVQEFLNDITLNWDHIYIETGVAYSIDDSRVVGIDLSSFPVDGIVNIKVGTQILDEQSFANCPLSLVVIPSTVVTVLPNAFENCTSLTSAIFSSGSTITTASNNMFKGCSVLETVVLPENLEVIGESMFENCTLFGEIAFPSSLLSIGNGAFNLCDSFNVAFMTHIDEGVEVDYRYTYSVGDTDKTLALQQFLAGNYTGWVVRIEGVLYNLSKTAVLGFEAANLPETGIVELLGGTISIAPNAFYACAELTRIIAPDTLVVIYENAFENCFGLAKIVFSSTAGCHTISENAFKNCSSLVLVAVPKLVHTIGIHAFYGCAKISQIRMVDSLNASYSYIYDIATVDKTEVMISFLSGTVENWSENTVVSSTLTKATDAEIVVAIPSTPVTTALIGAFVAELFDSNPDEFTKDLVNTITLPAAVFPSTLFSNKLLPTSTVTVYNADSLSSSSKSVVQSVMFDSTPSETSFSYISMTSEGSHIDIVISETTISATIVDTIGTTSISLNDGNPPVLYAINETFEFVDPATGLTSIFSIGSISTTTIIVTYSGTFTYVQPTADYNATDSPIINIDGSFTTLTKSTEVVGDDTNVSWEFVFKDTNASATDGLVVSELITTPENMTITDFGWIPLSRQGNQLKNYTGMFPTDSANIPTLLPDTSGLGMFYGATNFNQDISSWDTLTVTDMSYMFYNAPAFNQSLSSWSLDGITSTTHMFDGATAFNQPLGGWTMTAITDPSYMFANATAFAQDVSTWDLSAATTLAYMFAGAEAFNSSTNWQTTTNVTDMSHMFDGATLFNQLLDALDTTSATNLSYMFNGATSFNASVGSFVISQMTTAVGIFTGCNMSATNYAKTLQAWLNQSIVPQNMIDVGGVDYNYEGSIYVNQLINTHGWSFATGALAASSVFSYTLPTASHDVDYNPCLNNDGSFTLLQRSYEIDGDTATVYIDFIFDDVGASASDGLYLHGINSSTNMVITTFGGIPLSRLGRQFKQYIGEFPVSATNIPTLLPNTSGLEMFYESNKFNQDISGWDVSTMTTMSHMFYESVRFNQDVGGWNVSAVTTMSYMFYNCTSFNQDIGAWNVGSVTDMSYMFRHASNFNQNLGSWNVSSVTDMSFMFFRNYMFNSDISAWNVSSVATMRCMLYMAHSFNQNLGAWNISSLADMSNMLDSTNLSESNFSNTLIGWEAGSTPSDISLGAYDLTLNSAGLSAKNGLTSSPNNWQILIDILSPICFTGDCTVQTNSGLVRMDQIVAGKYTIRHIPIKYVTKTISRDKYLVKIERFALKNETPTQDIILSMNHRILYSGRMIKAGRLVCMDGVSYIDNNAVPLYNILLDQKCKGFIHVNGVNCESLCPSNGIVKLYQSIAQAVPETIGGDTQEEITQTLILQFNKEIEQKHYTSEQTNYFVK